MQLTADFALQSRVGRDREKMTGSLNSDLLRNRRISASCYIGRETGGNIQIARLPMFAGGVMIKPKSLGRNTPAIN